VIIYEQERVLIDRQTLAELAKRSVHTIRARCPVAEHRDGRALYDMEQCAAILDAIPTRQRRQLDRVA
jgi:phage terminase Nu1 subunit (DNA packaging protein)